MLVLSRKIGERIVIDHNTTVEIIRIEGDQVKLGIVALPHIAVHREEVERAIQEEEAA